MHLDVCQHVPFEGPAGIADWARDRGHELAVHRLDEGDSLPDPAASDGLVVLGGPMGVHDVDAHPWLAAERELIADALAAGTPVLGVCLGAQQLAAALGAHVAPHEHDEIGWFPIELTPAASTSPLAPLADPNDARHRSIESTDRPNESPAQPIDPLERPIEPLHWHGDAFAVPADATLLATSEACPPQAFVTDDGLGLGLQFHLEATPESVGRLLAAHDDLEKLAASEPWVQPPDQIEGGGRYEELRRGLDAVLDRFFGGNEGVANGSTGS